MNILCRMGYTHASPPHSNYINIYFQYPVALFTPAKADRAS